MAKRKVRAKPNPFLESVVPGVTGGPKKKAKPAAKPKAAPKSKTVSNALGSVVGNSGTGKKPARQAAPKSPTVSKALGSVVGNSGTGKKPPKAKPVRKSKTVTNALEGITGKPSKSKPKVKAKTTGKATVADALASITGGNTVDNALASITGVGDVKRPGAKKSGLGAGQIASILSDVGATAPIAEAVAMNPIGTITTHVIAAKTGLSKAEKEGYKLLSRAGRETVDIPLNTPAALYALGKTAKDDPKKAAKMVAQPYIDLVKHPGKSLSQHPVGSALLFSGLEASGGRSAGAVMRRSPSGTLRRVASTAREDAVVPGTSLRQQRRYSPDPVRKAAQKSAEKAATRRAVRKGERTPATMKDHEIKRRVDEHVAASEDIRRIERARAVEKAEAAVHDRAPGRRRKARAKPTAGTTLAAQGVARTIPELRAYLAELERQAPSLKGPDLKRNRTAQAEVRKAINARQVPTAAADRYAAEVSLPLQAELARRGMIDAEQAARARLIPYAVTKMGAKHEGGRIVARDGSELTNGQIRAHMAAHGVPEPAYVSNAANARGAKNFYIKSTAPPVIRAKPRTGAAITRGIADVHPDMLVEGAARAQGLITAHKRYAAFVKEFSVKRRDGAPKQYTSYAEAVRAAEHAVVDRHGNDIGGAVPLRPVLANPFSGRGEQLRATMDEATDVRTASHLSDAVNTALKGDEGKGPWVLVPEAAASRMQEHIRVDGTGVPGKTAQLVGSRFRSTVLATNPKWLFGNVAEPALVRAPVARAGVGSYLVGRGTLKRLERIDPEAALEANVRTVGGGQMAMVRRMDRYSSAEQFAGTRLAPVAQALGRFWQTPGPKQLAAVWHGYTRFVFDRVNAPIENAFQTAMLGKAIKQSPLMSDRLVKLSDAAMTEAARGLRDTNTMVALGREVDRMYGKYGKYSPAQRHLIAGYTPFIPWAINATTFLSKVLPADHPVLTSLIVSASQATEEWRKDLGLKFAEKDAPWFLQGSVPVGSGRLRVSKYTPFGVAQSPSGVPGTFADSLLPQFQSVILNLQGKDWKGKDLKPGQAPVIEAVKSLFLGSVPLVGQATRIANNPGSTGNKFRKELDPSYAIQPKGAGSGGGSALPPGVSQAEIDSLLKQAEASGPAVSQAEIDQLLREQGGG